MQHNTRTPAVSRTWDTLTHDEMDGAVVQTRRHTVTISNRNGVITAEIDGQPADALAADRILRGATTKTVTNEVIPFPSTMARALGVGA